MKWKLLLLAVTFSLCLCFAGLSCKKAEPPTPAEPAVEERGEPGEGPQEVPDEPPAPEGGY